MQKYAPFEHNDYIHISMIGKAIHFLQSGFVPKTWHIQNPIEREQARIISYLDECPFNKIKLKIV